MKLIVFDWDGTLADSIHKIVLCKQFLAKKYGLPLPTEEAIRQVLGMQFEIAMRLCFPHADHALLSILSTEFHTLMQEKEYQADLFPGAKEMLIHLKREGYRLAIATSKNALELRSAMDTHGLDGIFDLVCCGSDYQNKPDPAMLNHMMYFFNLTGDDMIMIGDTVTDIAFAKNAHVKVIAVTFGAHDRDPLQLAKPDFLLDDFKSILDVVEGLCSFTKALY